MTPGASIREEVGRAAAEHGFSGAVMVEVEGEVLVDAAFGSANRAHAVANTPATRFAIASGVKGLTALTVMRLVELGSLSLSTPARSLLGPDLPLIDERATVEHLLAHRSGIGDYLDESTVGSITDYVMPVPVHRLDSLEGYLPALDGHPQVFEPDERFAYNNAGYVVVALLAERATGTSFADLVDQHVCRPAGMHHTAFLRSDELPGDAAVGYLHADGLRSNVLHLPVLGAGDGGLYSTTADVHALWRCLPSGGVVAAETFAMMTHPRSTLPSGDERYGLGFWLAPETDGVQLEGYDAGVSFRSVHQPSRRCTYTVVSNSSEGAWPMCAALRALIDPHG